MAKASHLVLSSALLWNINKTQQKKKTMKKIYILMLLLGAGAFASKAQSCLDVDNTASCVDVQIDFYDDCCNHATIVVYAGTTSNNNCVPVGLCTPMFIYHANVK